jgi:hypothetical protein
MSEFPILTEEEIEAARSPRGGWTAETLAGWGVSWPPPKGWRDKLLGKPSFMDREPCICRFDPALEPWARGLCEGLGLDPDGMVGNPVHPRWHTSLSYAEIARNLARTLPEDVQADGQQDSGKRASFAQSEDDRRPNPKSLNLQEIADRAEAATPGPWLNGFDDLEGVVSRGATDDGNVVCLPPSGMMEHSLARWPANAAFIAAAREDIPALLSELQKAREALAIVGDPAWRLAEAYAEGFQAALGREPWDDASDYAWLCGKEWADKALRQAPSPAPVGSEEGGS